jgi:hypothetical protein
MAAFAGKMVAKKVLGGKKDKGGNDVSWTFPETYPVPELTSTGSFF